jgi:hypothetical protein
LSEYSISDFLEALSDDDLERKMIEFVSEGYSDEELLTKLLALIGRKKK